MESRKNRFRFNKKRVYFYAFAISLGGFLFGERALIPLGFGEAERTLIIFHDPTLHSYYEMATLIGAVFGALAGYFLIDYGRRTTMLSAALQFIIASILSILPIPYAPYYIAIKFFIGVGVGYMSFLCPLFIYEIAPFYERGRLIALHQLLITIGVFYASLFQFFYYNESHHNINFPDFWIRSIIIFIGPVLVCLIIIILFLFKYTLQTPAFYLAKQNFFEVKDVIEFIYLENDVQKTIASVVTQQREDPTQNGTIEQAVQAKRCKAFMAASGILVTQVLTGINSVLLKLFQVGDKQKYLFLIIAAINILSLFSFIFFLHNIPRKILIVGGLLLLSSCQASVLCFSYGMNQEKFVFFLSCCFVFIFQFSMGPIAWIQVHQILEPKLAAIASSLNWLFNFIVALLTLKLESNYAILTIIFSSICFISAFIIMWLYPQTNHKTKKEIQEFLTSWHPSFWKPTTIIQPSDIGSINESLHP